MSGKNLKSSLVKWPFKNQYISGIICSPHRVGFSRLVKFAKEDMIKPVKIQIPTTVTLHVKQAQIVPHLGSKPLRKCWDEVQMQKQAKGLAGRGSRHETHPSLPSYSPIPKEASFYELLTWSKDQKNELLEIHLPGQNWATLKHAKAGLLANPKYETALYFVGAKRFNAVCGHPDGTECFVINDSIYRVLTWRSITTTWWDKKRRRDSKIVWREDDKFIYFLSKCEKISREPIKSLIVDSIGLELLDRDRPKEIAF